MVLVAITKDSALTCACSACASVVVVVVCGVDIVVVSCRQLHPCQARGGGGAAQGGHLPAIALHLRERDNCKHHKQHDFLLYLHDLCANP